MSACYVVVQLAPCRSARQARGESAVLTRREVKRLLAEHGAELIGSAPPGSTKGRPSESATIAVPDMTRADKLAAALRGVDGIETAYAKPGEELP